MHLYRISGVDFTQIDGFGVLTVLTQLVLSWAITRLASHLPSILPLGWGCVLAPASQAVSAKVLAPRRVVNRVANEKCEWRRQPSIALTPRWVPSIVECQRAWALLRRSLLPLTNKARIFYYLWKSAEPYVDPGIDSYEQQYQERVVKNLQKKALALGFDLVAKPTAPECVS